MPHLPQQLKGIAIATVFFVGLLYVQAWTGAPAGIPPANNVDAPINVGVGTQYKSGSLGIGGLLKVYGTFNVETGAGLGKVLTSDVTGNASWTPVSSLGVVTSITGGSCAVGQVVQSISSTGVATCVITSESDPTVPASMKDGVSWGEITGKPSGTLQVCPANGYGSCGRTAGVEYPGMCLANNPIAFDFMAKKLKYYAAGTGSWLGYDENPSYGGWYPCGANFVFFDN